MPPDGPLLKLADVTRRFDSTENAAAVLVLDRVSLEVARGESLAIVGPSGSGKSTLLQIMGTLDIPTSGDVFFEGRLLRGCNEKQLTVLRNREIGFVFQLHYLLPQCSVLENVLVPTLPARQNGSPRAVTGEPALDRAKRLLGRVGLAKRLEHWPAQLSGGERQRVAVVRALINRPKLLLADEPTGALDHASAEELASLLTELNREEGTALVLVTHALDLARKLGRVLTLRDGRISESRTV